MPSEKELFADLSEQLGVPGQAPPRVKPVALRHVGVLARNRNAGEATPLCRLGDKVERGQMCGHLGARYRIVDFAVGMMRVTTIAARSR